MRSASLLALGLGFVVIACGGPSESPKAPAAAGAASAWAPAVTAPDPIAQARAAGPTAGSPASNASPVRAAPAPSPASSAASASNAFNAAKAPPTKISARHVLIQWMGCSNAPANIVRTRDQAMSVAQEVLKRAKAGEDFGKLAVEFSDEPNAGQRGGSLGRFGRGMMVKQFEDAAFALQPGEISGIVETGFGFHVIQRTE
jgi:hypothetical protein